MLFWLCVQDQQLMIKTWRTKFEINNQQVAAQLLQKFPELNGRPVLVDEKEMMTDAICRKIYQSVQNSERLAETNAEHGVPDEPVDLNRIHHKKALIDHIKEMPKECFRVVFPAEYGCIAMHGEKEDMLTVIQRMEQEDLDVVDPVLALYAKEKGKESQKSQDKNQISYFAVTDDSVGIQEKYVFRNIALCGEEWTDLQGLNLIDSKAIHTELNQLSNLFQKMDSDIEGYGFGAYHQIPFKISDFQYKVLNERKRRIAAGAEPGEVYVRAIKMGMADLLSSYTEEPKTRWVMAQTKLDVMIEAVLPLIFDHIFETAKESLKAETVDLKQYEHVVLDLLKQKGSAFDLQKLECKMYSIQNTGLMKCMLSQNGKQNLVIEGYGVDKNQILDSLWINYYAIMIQNPQVVSKSSESMKIRIGNDSDLHGEEEQEKYDQIRREIDEVLLRAGGLEIKIQRWKYNHYLKDTNMECLRVKIL